MRREIWEGRPCKSGDEMRGEKRNRLNGTKLLEERERNRKNILYILLRIIPAMQFALFYEK